MNDTRVLERGYRRYEGPRRTQTASITSLMVHSLQRVVGLRRSAGAKILPILAAVISYLPAVAFVGIAALMPPQMQAFLPGYHQYYGFVYTAIFLFIALVSPELLCADRRSRLLSLYYASPLTPTTYLAAKAGAILIILAVVTLGPPLLLTIAYAFQGVGPDGIVDLSQALGQIVAAGLTLSFIYGSVALAVSSLTDRRAVASAGIILLLLVPNAITAILYQAFDMPLWVTLITFTDAPFELVQRIYGQTGAQPDVSTWILAGACGGGVVVTSAFLVWRYRTMDVSR